jgi:prophage maintenance system killer protein
VILFELTNTEEHPLYQALEISNGNRQYDFLRSIVYVAVAAQRTFLSTVIIKALNFQAVTCLHINAGEFRPCQVTVGTHEPPAHHRVGALMDDLVNQVNYSWEKMDAVALATWVLWRLNFIHPFINGNGRTARAAAYFILCVKSGGWLTGEPILPELIRQHRDAYVAALQCGDATFAAGNLDLGPLHSLISDLLRQQMANVPSNGDSPPQTPPPPLLTNE